MRKILPALLLLGYTAVNARSAPDSMASAQNLKHFFAGGKVTGLIRYYFMATDNAPGLSDYHAHAIGGGVKYETAVFHGFRLGIGTFSVFNIGSSDLTQPDPVTKQPNRYELGLFDVANPVNKDNMTRLEDLYLRYDYRSSYAIVGRQDVNTPFINQQDGRMNATKVQGISAHINEFKNLQIELDYFNAISPRSTARWYSIGESIGLYPLGVQGNGVKSGYLGNLNSNGIAIAGITWNAVPSLKLQVWDHYVDNIFNTIFAQADYKYTLGSSALIAGVQGVLQQAVNNGGNADTAKTYFKKGGKTETFGARIGWQNKRTEVTLNYNRITKDGRFLMPREWGKEPFYTFLPREKTEGSGDMTAVMLKGIYQFPKVHLRTMLGIGHYEMPDVTNYALNKYGFPSYNQLDADVRYEFNGWLKGLSAQFLFMYKQKTGDSHNNDKYVINKVDMASYNFVVNYRF
ncbi:OprD family outer membrane porin [Chitinophagaceae bacterium MMS25-I14]